MIIPRSGGRHDAQQDEWGERASRQGDPARYTTGMPVYRWEECVDGRNERENERRRQQRTEAPSEKERAKVRRQNARLLGVRK